MSNKTITKLATADEAVEETSAVEEPNQEAQIIDGVLQLTDYNFVDYTDGGSAGNEMSIGDKFAPGFDPTPYDFSWFRFNNLGQASKRFFIKVDKTLHGKWFKPGAFSKTHAGVTCGERFMDGTKPEFYLMVRSAEAKRQEDTQMLARVRAQTDIENNGEFKAVISGLGQGVGSGNISGGVTRTQSGW